MALKLADRLEANNPKAYGIVKATEISGHRSVMLLTSLYKIPDCILSESKINDNNDAIGQIWYVVDEGCYYTLINWNQRKNNAGWRKYEPKTIVAGERILITDLENNVLLISALSEINDNLTTSLVNTWSIDKMKSVMSGIGTNIVTDDNNDLKLKILTDDLSIGIADNYLSVLTVDGGIFNNN